MTRVFVIQYFVFKPCFTCTNNVYARTHQNHVSSLHCHCQSPHCAYIYTRFSLCFDLRILTLGLSDQPSLGLSDQPSFQCVPLIQSGVFLFGLSDQPLNMFIYTLYRQWLSEQPPQQRHTAMLFFFTTPVHTRQHV